MGWTPIPPYILKARREGHVNDGQDRVWYETVYADPHRRHSVAAPTAGLHFTPALLAGVDDAGVRRLGVTLHVGAGTFRPIRVDLVEKHRMDAERFEVSASVLASIRGARGAERGAALGRVIAVGTTVVRVLESLPAAGEGPVAGRTDLLITPPYRFKHTDGMLTNFHLPHSTLLALVAAMVGLKRLKAVYREAIERRYRFYSYGDAMLVLPYREASLSAPYGPPGRHSQFSLSAPYGPPGRHSLLWAPRPIQSAAAPGRGWRSAALQARMGGFAAAYQSECRPGGPYGALKLASR